MSPRNVPPAAGGAAEVRPPKPAKRSRPAELFPNLNQFLRTKLGRTVTPNELNELRAWHRHIEGITQHPDPKAHAGSPLLWPKYLAAIRKGTTVSSMLAESAREEAAIRSEIFAGIYPGLETYLATDEGRTLKAAQVAAVLRVAEAVRQAGEEVRGGPLEAEMDEEAWRRAAAVILAHEGPWPDDVVECAEKLRRKVRNRIGPVVNTIRVTAMGEGGTGERGHVLVQAREAIRGMHKSLAALTALVDAQLLCDTRDMEG